MKAGSFLFGQEKVFLYYVYSLARISIDFTISVESCLHSTLHRANMIRNHRTRNSVLHASFLHKKSSIHIFRFRSIAESASSPMNI